MDTESQKQLERQETLEAIKKLNLLDDNLMTLVFDRNIEAAELLLNVILQRNDLKVLEVEVQRSSAGADVHRARFHSSMIDTKMFKA